MNVVAAVDCGATSIRVCRVDLDAPLLDAEVVHRVPHAPIRDQSGHLRWDWDRIVDAVTIGLERCQALGPLASIGIDTWAVDYGLLDESGQLISAPYSYRDHRTEGYRRLVDSFGAAAMYRINGLQLQPFNTIFQLAHHDPGELDRATRLLWLPELLIHHLTGVALTERTSAASSGLLDVHTGDWSDQLLDVAGIDRSLLGGIDRAGRVVGDWRGVPVTLVAGHDTASGVAGMGAGDEHAAFVASGTWMLAGVERTQADTTDWARVRNFTNEAGAVGGFRFLRNVTGFWLLEQCRPQWGDPTLGELLLEAEQFTDAVPVVDVDDDRLRSPDDMLAAYTELAALPTTAPRGLVTRSIVESIARRTAAVLVSVAEVEPHTEVILFGGAARMSLLRRRLAELTGRLVRTGAAEATALGNAIVQGIALGIFADLDEGRSRISMTSSDDR